MATSAANFTNPSAVSAETGRTAKLLSAGFVILLGALFLFSVGFAQPVLVHDAAHDTRHGLSLPCH